MSCSSLVPEYLLDSTHDPADSEDTLTIGLEDALFAPHSSDPVRDVDLSRHAPAPRLHATPIGQKPTMVKLDLTDALFSRRPTSETKQKLPFASPQYSSTQSDTVKIDLSGSLFPMLSSASAEDPHCVPCAPSIAVKLDGDSTAFSLMTCPSVGSVGHPYRCAAPCKYHLKPAGCKDGKMCARCHLCKWSRKHSAKEW